MSNQTVIILKTHNMVLDLPTNQYLYVIAVERPPAKSATALDGRMVSHPFDILSYCLPYILPRSGSVLNGRIPYISCI